MQGKRLWVLVWLATVMADQLATRCAQAGDCGSCLARLSQGDSCGFLTMESRQDMRIISACLPGNNSGPYQAVDANRAVFEFGFCCTTQWSKSCDNCTESRIGICGFNPRSSECAPMVDNGYGYCGPPNTLTESPFLFIYYSVIFVGVVVFFVLLGVLYGWGRRRLWRRRRPAPFYMTAQHQSLTFVRSHDRMAAGDVCVTVLPPRKSKRRKVPVPVDVYLEAVPTQMLPFIGPADMEELELQAQSRYSSLSESDMQFVPAAGMPLPVVAPGQSIAAIAAPSLGGRSKSGMINGRESRDVTPPMLAQSITLGDAPRTAVLGLQQLWVGVKILHEDGPPYMSTGDTEGEEIGVADAREERPEPSAAPRRDNSLYRSMEGVDDNRS